ncbi:hypothetical protein B0T13DRAFT_479664 [Neurospora crassa]|nr:hypothetical protein B0T13DRAFT_479664 [Neurospora crassa]
MRTSVCCRCALAMALTSPDPGFGVSFHHSTPHRKSMAIPRTFRPNNHEFVDARDTWGDCRVVVWKDATRTERNTVWCEMTISAVLLCGRIVKMENGIGLQICIGLRLIPKLRSKRATALF